MTTQTINVKMNDNTQKILDGLGLSLSDAVNIFLDKVTIEGKIPFEYPDYDVPAVSDEEIAKKLEEAEEDFRQGKFMSYDQFKEKIGEMSLEHLDYDLPAVSDDEIAKKLEEAEKSFKEGRFYTEEEFFDRMEKLYNV